MSTFKRILHHAGEGIHQYNMINEGDKIMVCLSGGKDSYTLLEVLLSMQKKSSNQF